MCFSSSCVRGRQSSMERITYHGHSQDYLKGVLNSAARILAQHAQMQIYALIDCMHIKYNYSHYLVKITLSAL